MNRAYAALSALALAAALPAPAAAQEIDPAMMAAAMAAATPGENHAVLEPLIGSWDHSLKMWMAPGAPPMEMTATSVAEWTFDGRYIQGTYEGAFMGMPFHGRDLVGYDNLRGEYVSVWVDNHSTAPMIGRGGYDPATRSITMEGTVPNPMTGDKNMPFRSVTTFNEDGTTTMESYAPGPDGEMYKTMEIVSTKRAE